MFVNLIKFSLASINLLFCLMFPQIGRGEEEPSAGSYATALREIVFVYVDGWGQVRI
jgi:hypothetical protein